MSESKRVDLVEVVKDKEKRGLLGLALLVVGGVFNSRLAWAGGAIALASSLLEKSKGNHA